MEDPIVDSEIFHGGKGRDVERWLKPRNKFFVFEIAYLLISISLHCSHLCCCFTYTFYLLLVLHSSLHYVTPRFSKYGIWVRDYDQLILTKSEISSMSTLYSQ